MHCCVPKDLESASGGGGRLLSGWISIQNCNYIKEQTEMGKAD